MLLDTESGSTYEIDLAGQRARRLGNVGGSSPTECFADGWRDYTALSSVVWPDGAVCVLFVWAEGAPHGFTRTSPVIAVDGELVDEFFLEP